MAARASKARSGKRRSKSTYIVSACLAGFECAYDGSSRLKATVRRLVERGRAIPACPEVSGGLSVPREQAEISGGDGNDVLAGNARVLTVSGADVTDNYLTGSRACLRLARRHNIKRAILKSKSPACGSGVIYDGTFTKTPARGDGLFAALLKKEGIRVDRA